MDEAKLDIIYPDREEAGDGLEFYLTVEKVYYDEHWKIIKVVTIGKTSEDEDTEETYWFTCDLGKALFNKIDDVPEDDRTIGCNILMAYHYDVHTISGSPDKIEIGVVNEEAEIMHFIFNRLAVDMIRTVVEKVGV